MAFAPGCFCGLVFGAVSLGRNFAKSQKMRDEGVLAKFAIAWLWEPRFEAKCCSMFALQVHSNYEMTAFAPCRVFLWPTFWRSFPWLQLCKISENARGSVLAKFAIARLYGCFGSRGLQQNVVLCLHFKCILIRR